MADNFTVNTVTVRAKDNSSVYTQGVFQEDNAGGYLPLATSTLQGALTETAPATDTASSGINGRLQRVAQRLTSLIALFPAALGAGGGVKVDIVSGAGSGGTALTDEATFTLATTSVTPIAGVYNSTPDTVATGKAAALQMTAARGMHAHIVDAAGATVSLTTSTITGAVTETAPATDTASSGLNGRLQRIAQRITSFIALFPAALGSNGGLKVDIVGGGGSGGTAIADEATFTPASTSFTPTGGIFNTTPDTLTTGKGGAFAMSAARGQHALLVDSAGVPVVASGSVDINIKAIAGVATTADATWSYAPPANGLVNTTGVTAKTAAGAGVRNYITGAHISNAHQTVGTEVMIRDGAAGTVLHRSWAQFAGGGGAYVFDPPLRGTANTLVEIAEASITASNGVCVNLQGFTAI